MNHPSDHFCFPHFDEQKLLSIMKYALLFTLAFCFICIVIVFLQAFLCGGWRLIINQEGVKGMISFWQPYQIILKVLFSCLTLYIAMATLEKHIDVETCKCLSNLRDKFNSEGKKALHYQLLDEEDKTIEFSSLNTDNSSLKERQAVIIEIFDYLGTIELGAIMLEKGLINKEEFENQFGYRLENCLKNKDICNHLQKYSAYYEKLKIISFQLYPTLYKRIWG